MDCSDEAVAIEASVGRLPGDNERVAAAIAGELGLKYRANLLPEDRIGAVRALQEQGAVVMVVGDGVNDAPALAQANVGIAMGAAGTAAAIEAADVALMRDGWRMVPEAVRVGRRAAGTIRQNLGFTAAYNVVEIGLAFLGLLHRSGRQPRRACPMSPSC